MELLRRYQKEMTLRIAAADLSGALPLVQVSDRLTWLAESLVDAALTRAWDEMRELYGEPLRGDGERAGFAVIASGKFGGIELGHGDRKSHGSGTSVAVRGCFGGGRIMK